MIFDGYRTVKDRGDTGLRREVNSFQHEQLCSKLS